MSFKQLHGPGREQFPDSIGQKDSAASMSVVLASDYALPIALDNDTNFGTPGPDTLRTAAMLGVGSTAVSNANPVPVSDAGASLTVDGTVAATQSGTWNVNNISGTVSLPTGAATEATLAAMSAKLPAALGQAAMAASLTVAIASDQTAIPISNLPATVATDSDVSNASTLRVVLATRHEDPTTPVAVRLTNGSAFQPAAEQLVLTNSMLHSYVSTPVDDTSWVEIFNSTSDDAYYVSAFDSSGRGMEIGVGGIGSEVRALCVPPGGIDGQFKLFIPTGSRVSVRCMVPSQTASSGYLIFSAYGLN